MTKQTDTSADAVEQECRIIHDCINRNKTPTRGLHWVDMLRYLAAERDELQARVTRLETALNELHDVSLRAVGISREYSNFKLYAMEPMEQAISAAYAALRPDRRRGE